MALATFGVWPRNGFTLVKRSNTNESYVMNMPAKGTGVNQPLCNGDACTRIAGIVAACTAGQDPTNSGFGLVLGVYTTAGRPFTQQTNKFIASGGVGSADVLYDPGAEFVVRCETSVGNSNIGTNLILVASSPSATGRSTMSVDIPASASINDLFRLKRLATNADLYAAGIAGSNNLVGGAGNAVVVTWNRHVDNPRTSGV